MTALMALCSLLALAAYLLVARPAPRRAPRKSNLNCVVFNHWMIAMIGKWTGTPLRTFLQRIGADLSAGCAGFERVDGYYEARGWLLRRARHGHRAAFADLYCVSDQRSDLTGQIRLPIKNLHPN
jgi:DMSO/TMAO reductase YedYZ molybdopterin-dependent catalytic subunit